MTESVLSQTAADALIAVEKHCAEDGQWAYPGLGGFVSVPLVSFDHRENFLLDISRGRIDLRKGTYQTRARDIVILVRLDFGGRPHRNPDGEEIPSPHLHVYREGYGDKIAVPVPTERFSNVVDTWQTLIDFMDYCNVTKKPQLQRSLVP